MVDIAHSWQLHRLAASAACATSSASLFGTNRLRLDARYRRMLSTSTQICLNLQGEFAKDLRSDITP